MSCGLATSAGAAREATHAGALPVASYTLHARLDTDLHRVDASGSITFTNRSTLPLDELWFHLYPNAFASDRSLFWRTSPAMRRNRRPLYRSGQLEVSELSIPEQAATNLWRADQTTPGDPDDTTDCRVALQHPIQPNETVVLSVKFVTQLPFMVERMGWVESFHAVAQWYPKLARLEPDGTWRHFPYQALSEFYADFGDYEITLDVPRSFTIAAAGESVVLSESQGRRVTRFRMPSVHDFAWFAWDEFKHTTGTAAGVPIDFYSPPGHAHNVKLEFAELAYGLARFQDWFGGYPYEQLVVVHPPDVAMPAGGMEYPGLIVTGGPWYTSFVGSRALSAVTLHELAHQWFYGVIATDEARYPVLDEGLASWAELHALTARYGEGSAFSGFGWSISANATAQWMGVTGYKSGPLTRPAADFGTFSELTRTVYARMALLLQTIANVYGQARLLAALHRYAQENEFRHPGPDSLVAALRAGVAPEAAANLATAFETDASVDFIPTYLISHPSSNGRWTTDVRIRSNGTLHFPVTVELSLADGSRVRHQCLFNDSECAFALEGTAAASSVTVDPEHAIVIESQYSNNTLWRTEPPKPRRLFEQLLYAFELILGGLS